MEYKELSGEEGRKYFPLIWTIFLEKEDANFFAEPFSNQRIRFRCFFDQNGSEIAGKGKLSVFFQLTKEEVEEFELKKLPKKIYFYGAYNQINVVQIKSYGKIRTMTQEEKESFIIHAIENLQNKGKGPFSLRDKEKEAEVLSVIKSRKGEFYRFDPISYSFNTYERG
jgi:hypothetical protein